MLLKIILLIAAFDSGILSDLLLRIPDSNPSAFDFKNYELARENRNTLSGIHGNVLHESLTAKTGLPVEIGKEVLVELTTVEINRKHIIEWKNTSSKTIRDSYYTHYYYMTDTRLLARKIIRSGTGQAHKYKSERIFLFKADIESDSKYYLLIYDSNVAVIADRKKDLLPCIMLKKGHGLSLTDSSLAKELNLYGAPSMIQFSLTIPMYRTRTGDLISIYSDREMIETLGANPLLISRGLFVNGDEVEEFTSRHFSSREVAKEQFEANNHTTRPSPYNFVQNHSEFMKRAEVVELEDNIILKRVIMDDEYNQKSLSLIEGLKKMFKEESDDRKKSP